MSNNETTQNQTVNIDEVINRLLQTLMEHEPHSTEYANAADQLEKLSKYKATLSQDKVSKDSILATFTNLAGIVLILGHEHVGPITSKALQFVMKSKL